MSRLAALVGALMMTVGMIAVGAQAAVTMADVGRLQATADAMSVDVERLKATDATLSVDVARALGELNDEIAALRVKLRREGAVAREEYASLRDRLDTLRVRAQGQKVTAQPIVADDRMLAGGRLPAGTAIDVRLQGPLSSATAKVEQRFEATTMVDVLEGSKLILPAGSIVRGFVSSVRPAGNIERRGSLTLSFDELRVGNRSYRLRASVTQAIDGRMNEDTARITAGAAVGAIIGGLLGGGKGAIVGVIVGGGGTVAATDGTNVELPAGTILRIKLDQPIEIEAP